MPAGMASMASLLCLPDSLIATVLTEWVELQDVSRFDSSVCSKALRPVFCRAAFSEKVYYCAERCVEPPGPSTWTVLEWLDQHPKLLLEWAIKRSAGLKDLFLVTAGSEHPIPTVHDKQARRTYLNKFGSGILKVIGRNEQYARSNFIMSELLADICTRCPNVQEVNGSNEFNVADVKTICTTWPNLQSITLSTASNDAMLRMIGEHCPNVTCLDARNSRVTQKGWQEYLGLRGGNMHKLSAPKAADTRKSAALCLSVAHNCPQLRSLRMAIGGVTAPVITELLTKCPLLHELDLGSSELSNVVVNALAAAADRYTVLTFCKGGTATDLSMTALLSGCKNLRRLDIERCHMRGQSLSALANFCISLTDLRLNWPSLEASSLRVPLTRMVAANPLLRKLDLSTSWLGDSGLIDIMTARPELTYLGLNQCSDLTDAPLLVLPQLCPYMQELYLVETGATEVGLRAVVLQCRKLKVLHVTQTFLWEVEQAVQESNLFRPGLRVVGTVCAPAYGKIVHAN